MQDEIITAKAMIDSRIFRRFAAFDTLILKKRWRAPLLFALIFAVSALVCFFMRERREGAALLGWVLLGVGLGLPLVYFFSFWLSVRAQCKKMQLDKPRLAYTLSLEAQQLGVAKGGEKAAYPWDKAFAAYRDKACIYLYITPQNAYLLPEGCANADTETIWALLCDALGQGRATDYRK